MTDSEQIPYFLQLVENNDLLKKIITERQLNSKDLEEFRFKRPEQNQLHIYGFQLTKDDVFSSIQILVTRFGIIIQFESPNQHYFDDAAKYFDTSSRGAVSLPYNQDEKKFPVRCKRSKRLTMLGKTIDCSIYKCDLYGCKIILSVN